MTAFYETTYLKHPRADAQDGTDANKARFLLRLADEEDHIKEMAVAQNRWLDVEENAREVFSQLIVI
jgi:hypothetical protein